MTVVTTYKATGTRKSGAGDRFVRACYPTGYAWCVRGAHNLRYDVAQGTCAAEDLPDDVRLAADVLRGHAFAYVEWPK